MDSSGPQKQEANITHADLGKIHQKFLLAMNQQVEQQFNDVYSILDQKMGGLERNLDNCIDVRMDRKFDEDFDREVEVRDLQMKLVK